MKKTDLSSQIRSKKTFLTVGLDPDFNRIPSHLKSKADPIFEFNKNIIDHTKEHCIAYKPNIAFYEAQGIMGWESLIKTEAYIPKTHFKIADAKRGDIGNTSRQYAEAFFKQMNFDAITVAPYMGIDSVSPFLEYTDKWVILLGLTSNKGSKDFQFIKNAETGKYLFEEVIESSIKWGTTDNLMFVIGATHPENFEGIRKIIPDHFLLVPGVGAQGGDLEAIIKYGANQNGGLLINSSRGIIFSSEGEDYAEAAGRSAAELSEAMSRCLGGNSSS